MINDRLGVLFECPERTGYQIVFLRLRFCVEEYRQTDRHFMLYNETNASGLPSRLIESAQKPDI